jgi:hypothetical protein
VPKKVAQRSHKGSHIARRPAFFAIDGGFHSLLLARYEWVSKRAAIARLNTGRRSWMEPSTTPCGEQEIT